MRASDVSLADVNGNRLLVVVGAAAEAALASPKSFFDTFSTTASFDSLIVGRIRNRRVRMCVLERDGSESAFCGNGSLALAAAFGHAIVIESPHGLVPAMVRNKDAIASLPRPVRLACIADEPTAYAACGEPHALYRVGRAWRNPPGAIGAHQVPHRNCTVVERRSPNKVLIRTYERGVNAETGSCGTGACAAVAMLEQAGAQLARRVHVEMAGGTLVITRQPDRLVLAASVALTSL